MNTRRSLRFHVMALAWVVTCTLACGCYSTRRVGVDELSSVREDGTYRLSLRDGTEVRVRLSPVYTVNRESIGCRYTAFDAASWEIRYGGFPAVYRAGKSWRQEATGEVVQIRKDKIASASVEELDWILTTVASPILLPAGFVDFLANNIQIGFSAVNDRFDSFSRPPRSVAAPSNP